VADCALQWQTVSPAYVKGCKPSCGERLCASFVVSSLQRHAHESLDAPPRSHVWEQVQLWADMHVSERRKHSLPANDLIPPAGDLSRAKKAVQIC